VHTPSVQAVKLGLSIATDRAFGDSEDSIIKGAEKSVFIMAGTALLCPVESIGIASALDPKNGSQNIINSYKKSISNGSINGLYPTSRVLSAAGRSGAGVVSFTMGGDYINSKFRDENGKIKGNDIYKASFLTGVVTALGCTPLELAHFWGKDAKGEYSMKTLANNVAKAARGGSGIGVAMVPRMAITVPLVAARNMGRLESPLEHHLHHHDEHKQDKKSLKDSLSDSKNAAIISGQSFVNNLRRTSSNNQFQITRAEPKKDDSSWKDKVQSNASDKER
jgi:hypothetical protein